MFFLLFANKTLLQPGEPVAGCLALHDRVSGIAGDLTGTAALPCPALPSDPTFIWALKPPWSPSLHSSPGSWLSG